MYIIILVWVIYKCSSDLCVVNNCDIILIIIFSDLDCEDEPYLQPPDESDNNYM